MGHPPLPGMARLPGGGPAAQAAFPLTSNVGQSGQAIPISATLNVHYSDGSSRVHARQPIARNVREPGYGQQVAQFDQNHGLR